ncbi:CASPASE_P20 domain-containing protein [Rubrivivax sp. A210]|uniref:caspase family protein n=1 Tax=Rubrivivax sp. A210 TaxID=2772301 RepID=UPI0019192EFB|nr:caspase family protein [Rubrivivax sp. A210]CAD5372693.1 CASPASE_P20 domain-containing protein [Rubrivivax sp. A210]
MKLDTHNPPAAVDRRRLLQAGGAWAGLAALPSSVYAQTATEGPEPPRLALLIGNRDYPEGEDLPPIHKNVRDLRAALEKRGFTVSEGLDLDLAQARKAMDDFGAKVRAAPPDATVLFYFSGHGAQVDSENLLVSARTSPKALPDNLARASLMLRTGVVGQLPLRPQGLTIAIIDACRTTLREVSRGGGGLNQVEAPPGCLIAFATGAGKPAIAPADDTRNTFYTASLVKLLETSSDEISFYDLFHLVKSDVQDTMLNHPVPLLRQFAQYPFIAENTRIQRRLAPRAAAAAAVAGTAASAVAAPSLPPRFEDNAEEQDYARLQSAIWPPEVARLATEYLAKHPKSRLAGSAEVAREGAAEAAKILRRNDVRLFRSAFDLPAGNTGDIAADLTKAARGNKDAAARLGRSYRAKDAADRGRYEGWLQYAAALGNGIASYELALHYRRFDQPLLAAQFESRALDLGYTPPPSLDNTRK